MEGIHTFDNGVKVYRHHIMSGQFKRYNKQNVHEVDEEEIFINTIKLLPPNGHYLSVGSAIGYYPILAKKLSPNLNIHNIEPLTIHMEYFIENIVLNNFSPEDFIMYNIGISESSGHESFIESRYGSKINRHQDIFQLAIDFSKTVIKRILTHLSIREYPKPKKTTIQTISIDEFIKKIGQPIDLIQMDIQGFEVEALMGGRESMQKGDIGFFLIGTHGKTIHNQCIDILIKYNYSIKFEDDSPRNQPDGIILAHRYF